MKVSKITVEELKQKLDRGTELLILDVRNPTAWGGSDVQLPGALRIPMDEFEVRADELDPALEAMAYCT
jgi:rhodanese-related sulfurtransferase